MKLKIIAPSIVGLSIAASLVFIYNPGNVVDKISKLLFNAKPRVYDSRYMPEGVEGSDFLCSRRMTDEECTQFQKENYEAHEADRREEQAAKDKAAVTQQLVWNAKLRAAKEYARKHPNTVTVNALPIAAEDVPNNKGTWSGRVVQFTFEVNGKLYGEVTDNWFASCDGKLSSSIFQFLEDDGAAGHWHGDVGDNGDPFIDVPRDNDKRLAVQKACAMAYPK